MKFNIITLFPEFFSGPLSNGLMQRAVDKKLVEFQFVNPRDFADDKRQTVDDRPYGGGPGMVMLLSPLVRAISSLGFQSRLELPEQDRNFAPGCQVGITGQSDLSTTSMLSGQSGQSGQPEQFAQPSQCAPTAQSGTTPSSCDQHIPGSTHTQGIQPPPCQTPKPGRLLAMSPKGRPLTQAFVRELAQEESVTILCGRYEGFDARLLDIFPVEEVSIGDFVLNGGETAALAVCEAAARLVPGFMGHEESGEEESFSSGLLEYPHYTRPEDYAGLEVPEILRSGDHGKVADWRRGRALEATMQTRPELLERLPLSRSDMDILRAVPRELAGRNLYVALVHHPVLGKDGKIASVSLTNLDIHDISRSSCTYGLGAFFVVTPLEDQLFILDKVVGHWVRGAGAKSNPDRMAALSKVRAVRSLEEAVAQVESLHGERPLLWGSSAAYDDAPDKDKKRRRKKVKLPELISFDEARKILYTRPAILLLGTSHGLAPEVITGCDNLLPPLRRAASYNHLSVRCAGTVLLDRILGEWG